MAAIRVLEICKIQLADSDSSMIIAVNDAIYQLAAIAHQNPAYARNIAGLIQVEFIFSSHSIAIAFCSLAWASSKENDSHRRFVNVFKNKLQ